MLMEIHKSFLQICISRDSLSSLPKPNMQSRRSCNLSLALIVIIFNCLDGRRVLTAAKSDLGPVRIWPKKGAYSWEASVDRESGIATSKETGTIPTGSRLYRSLNSTSDRDLLRFTENLFSPYPTWLVQFPVTLGLLKATPDKKGGFEIRDRLFGVNLISFGRTQGQRFSFQTSTNRGPTKTSQCTLALPITGGLLTLPDPSKPNGGNRGSLLFTLTKSREVGATDDSDEPSKTVCSITTTIGGYRPSIAGSAPVNVFRKWTYLSTQSIVHANVMWRYRRRCLGMTSDKVLSAKPKTIG
jgi:hypothetical protein